MIDIDVMQQRLAVCREEIQQLYKVSYSIPIYSSRRCRAKLEKTIEALPLQEYDENDDWASGTFTFLKEASNCCG
jgi:hypothetical protein